MSGFTIPINMINLEPCQDIIKLLKEVLDNPLLPPSIKDEAQTRLCILLDKAEQNAQETKCVN